MVTTKEQLKSLAKRRIANVEIEGETFYLRSLNGKELVAFVGKHQNNPNEAEAAFEIVSLCLCDENGGPFCDDAEGIALIQELELAILLPLAVKCREHCKLDEQAEAKLVKN